MKYLLALLIAVPAPVMGKSLTIGWALFPPLVVQESGKPLHGAIVEKIHHLMDENKIPHKDEVLPYSRLYMMYKKKQIDFMVHTKDSALEIGYLVSDHPFSATGGGLWSLQPLPPKMEPGDLKNLPVKRCVALVRGYTFMGVEKHLAKGVDAPVHSDATALEMLLSGRCDYLLGYSLPTQKHVDKLRKSGRFREALARLNHRPLFLMTLYMTINPAVAGAPGILKKLEASMVRLYGSSGALTSLP